MQRRTVFGFFLILVGQVLTEQPSFAQREGGYHGWGMGPGMMGDFWGMGWLGGILMVIFWVLVIVALVFLIKWLAQASARDRGAKPEDSKAIDILRERYARGEINKEEFDRMKRDLQ